jgi:hypothetical protein
MLLMMNLEKNKDKDWLEMTNGDLFKLAAAELQP